MPKKESALTILVIVIFLVGLSFVLTALEAQALSGTGWANFCGNLNKTGVPGHVKAYCKAADGGAGRWTADPCNWTSTCDGGNGTWTNVTLTYPECCSTCSATADVKCPADTWVNTGNYRWVNVGCEGNAIKEKQQKQQRFKDYYCSGESCRYRWGTYRWVDTGQTRVRECPAGQTCIVSQGQGVCHSCSVSHNPCGSTYCSCQSDTCCGCRPAWYVHNSISINQPSQGETFQPGDSITIKASYSAWTTACGNGTFVRLRAYVDGVQKCYQGIPNTQTNVSGIFTCTVSNLSAGSHTVMVSAEAYHSTYDLSPTCPAQDSRTINVVSCAGDISGDDCSAPCDTVCTSNITWRTSNCSAGAKVVLRESGALFADGANGSKDAPWITETGYHFDLINKADNSVLDSVFVKKIPPSSWTCSLSISPSSICANGGSITYSGSSNPSGCKFYWYGTKNGVQDANKVADALDPDKRTPFSYSWNPPESAVGVYTRYFKVFNDAETKVLCTSNSQSVEILPSPSVDIKANGSDGPITIAYNSSATLTWDSDNTDSCTASGGWSGSKATSGSQSTGNLTSSKTYTLTCTGPCGTVSDSVTVTAEPGEEAPNAPTNLSASAVSCSQINLSWTDNSNNETGFKIERKTGSGSWSQIATVGANTTSYQNTGLAQNTTYYYRVRAYNSAGNSSYSNTANATTPPCPVPEFSLENSGDIYATVFESEASNSSKSTITVIPSSGFDSTVTLSVSSISPELQGAEFHFSRTSLNSSQYSSGAKFWVTVPMKAPTGTYQITIQGVGSLLRQTTLNLYLKSNDPTWEEI